MFGLRRIVPVCPRFLSEVFVTKSCVHTKRVSDEKLYFLEDWKPPYLSQVQRNSLETSSANSILVNDFVNVTEEYNKCLENGETFNDVNKLCRIVDAYFNQADNMNFDELKISLQTLACWPQAVRSLKVLRRVPDRTEFAITQLYNIFKDEYNKRSWSYKCRPEQYIACSIQNIEPILELCEIWVHFQPNQTLEWNSYVCDSINKIANSTRKTKTRMKRMDKNTFIRFMKLVHKCQLGEDFHFYYCVFKFLDILPDMSLDEIALFCKIFSDKSVFGVGTHPVQLQIRKHILNKMIDNVDQIDENLVIQAYRYISPVQTCFISDLCYELQTEILKKNVYEKLGFQSCIYAIGLCYRLLGERNINIELLDIVVEMGLKLPRTEMLNLHSSQLLILSTIICFHRNTPRGRLLLLRIRDWLLADGTKRLQEREMMPFNFCLAFTGLINHQFCEVVFSSDTLVHVEKDGSICLQNILRYDEKNKKNKVTASMVLAFQGIVELDLPNYTGPRITSKLRETINGSGSMRSYIWRLEESSSDSFPEQEENFENHEISPNFKVLSRKALVEAFEKDKMFECSILPYFGVVGDVILLDDQGNPQSIPENFKLLPVHETKYGDNKHGTWMFLVKLGSDQLDKTLKYRLGGKNNFRRMCRKLGFVPVFLDGDFYLKLYNYKKFNQQCNDDKYESELVELYQQYIYQQVQTAFQQSKMIPP